MDWLNGVVFAGHVTIALALLFVLPGLALGPVLVPGASTPLARIGRAAGVSLLTTTLACICLARFGLLKPAVIVVVLVAMTVVPLVLRPPSLRLRVTTRGLRTIEKRGVDVVLVSRGDPEENRTMVNGHGLDARILLQPEGAGMIDAFARTGTPAAYLVDEHGRVAKPMALGADQVPELAREAAGRQIKLATERSLSESKLMRDGLPAGSPAPVFELPTVSGDTISLEQLRGSEALLVFSDPECGPCEVLAADLGRWHEAQGDDAPPVVMISRGDREENRRKVKEYGIDFPVAIQPAWKVSKAYGIFSTPVGFLIDENGVIVREGARGPEAVMALAHDALEHRKEVAPR